VPTTEGAAFAARTGCLFVESSAKTAVGVTEAFNDVVARIIDTPSLWREEKSKSSSPRTAGAAATGRANTTAASGPHTDGSMPGNIDLSQLEDEDASAGCLC
jgi:Ras-related protein Rab-18